MASQSQIVPSKNALRALRKLALGGSTVVGAVGSVSGLAFVSYDIRQRIQLAESIVETKRVLHSQPISNPDRKAQMVAVFDMYEKGQGKGRNESWRDFNRRARRHSTHDKLDNGRELVDTVIKEDAVHRADVASRLPHLKSAKGTPYDPLGIATVPSMPSNLPWERTRIIREEAASSRYNHNSSAAQRIIEATQKAHKINSHAVYGRPRESRSISSVQNIITATQRQHKLSSDVVFGRPAKKKDEEVMKLASCVQQWLDPADKLKAGAVHIIPKRSNTPRKAVESYQLPRYHSTLATQLPDDIDGYVTWPSTAKGQFDDAFFPNRDTRADVGANGRSFLQLVQNIKADATLQEGNLQRVPDTEPENPEPDVPTEQEDVQSKLTALIDSNLWVPHTTVDEVHDISAYSVSRIDLSPPSTDFHATGVVEKTVQRTTLEANGEPSDILEHLLTIIPQVRRRSGYTAARELAIDALKIYAQGGRPEDFRAMNKLHREFAIMLRLPFMTPVRQMIHFLLNTGLDEDRHTAGRILFSKNTEDTQDTRSNDCATGVVRYHYEKKALEYIDWLCSGRTSKSRIVHEFRKVLQIIYQRGAEPTEGMFSPVLELFLERGDLKYLRNMFEEMKAAHGIEPTGLTRTILLLGYAKANHWGQIVMEFEKMHQDGLSRKQPMSYAVTFNEVFRQHALSEPVEKTHDFLVNAICYWGLVPSTPVSATAVQTYIRHRRYDLVKEWIEAARYMFPHVNTGGEAFAYILAQTWAEIGASCEQIEDTCASIMRGRDNVIPGRFHAIVQEALAFHLARKLHAINADRERSNDQIDQAKDADDLFTQLKSAFAVILDDAGEGGVVKQGSVADLLSQSSAALRLRELFGAKTSIAPPNVKLATLLDRGPRKQANRHDPQSKDLVTPIPDALRRDILPDRNTIMSLVSAHYSQQLKLGQPVSHGILRVACRGLDQSRRRYDALCLISATYKGPAVQRPNGVMFDIGIIQTWMEMAYHLKSAVACKEIFTAVLEKGSAIRLTQQFMLLLSLATKKAYGTKFRRSDTQNPNVYLAKEVADLEYLVNRLRDRFYMQRMNPETKVGRKHDGLLAIRKTDTGDLRERMFKRGSQE
jgi:hypothetical protein